MTKILGIDTSNYTTSVAIVEDGKCIYDARKILNTKLGERGLRQSEALFQHIINLPMLLNSDMVRNLQGVSVSTKPRPVEGSYMPVFKAGETIARSIGYSLGVEVFETTHQEGHLEAAIRSIEFKADSFIAIHISGGTTEILKINRNASYEIEIVGKTLDISAGQLIDRVGVAMGQVFPCGRMIDELALKAFNTELRIPSSVKGLNMNFSGQETLCLKYIKAGNNQEDIAFATLLCIAKTFEKIIKQLITTYKLPILFMGGVASSKFLKNYLISKFKSEVYFSNQKYSSDNAVGIAFIGESNINGGL